MDTNGIVITATVTPFLPEEWIWIQVFTHWCVLFTPIANIINIKMQINLQGCPKQTWSFVKTDILATNYTLNWVNLSLKIKFGK